MFEYVSMTATVKELQQRINALQRPDAEVRRIAVRPELDDLLPAGGLKRGTHVSVRGSLRLALALAARASQSGEWCGAVGIPNLSYEASAELGIDLKRFVLVPSAL